MKSYLLFVDLKEAYDRVDRNVLLAKLCQLNFPDKFITFLTDYYFQDNILTSSTGTRSRTQYQKRGLRQGCNLSSVLFIIYVSELAHRIHRSGLGVRLESGEVIGILLFADDIILIASSPSDLTSLSSILESWCSDFKMLISVAKTNVISPDDDFECSLSCDGVSEAAVISQVASYKYLGVNQYLEPHRTSRHKGSDMVKRAQLYKNVILSGRRFLPDKVRSLSTVWCSLAVPGFLYAVDVVPVPVDVVSALDSIQNQVGKAVLAVPQSTASPVVPIELGWKPIQLMIDHSILRFFLRVTDPNFKGSALVRLCMDWNIRHGTTRYISNLSSMLASYGLTFINLPSNTHRTLSDHHRRILLARVQSLSSLSLLTISRVWWKLQLHVEESRWSRVLVRFRCMNAGLGNRDHYRSADSLSQDDGRVTVCPLCLLGPNTELHVLLGCTSLRRSRSTIFMLSGVSLESLLVSIRHSYNCQSDQEVARFFLGQERGLTRMNLVDRGLALDVLLTAFYSQWSVLRGRTISRLDTWTPF